MCVTLSFLANSVTPPRVQSYNVLLPNSQDGWWNYKMYYPPLDPDDTHHSSWEGRSGLLRYVGAGSLFLLPTQAFH